MNVLVGCERSGVVREAFRKQGHNAWSCDLVQADDNSKYHFVGDVLEYLDAQNWDIGIFHPPCTHLAVSGARWFKDKHDEQIEAVMFFMELVNADIPKIAIENPIGIMSTVYLRFGR